MKIAIDYPTVIMTDDQLWTEFLHMITHYTYHNVVVTYSQDSQEEAMALVKQINADNIEGRLVYEGEQAQDLLGADIWIHGRVDRVIGKDSIDFLLTNMKGSLTE